MFTVKRECLDHELECERAADDSEGREKKKEIIQGSRKAQRKRSGTAI